mgnify:CR=1 FL=1|tara:strand:- start:13869 stop:15041 length:1173 start_codon:yes stop_codon:yes gene_type:complete
MVKKKVCVIGLGYIGLPTAALLANKGFTVHGVDIKQDIIDTINGGNIHIVEPDLDEYVKEAVNNGNLKAHLEPAEADIFIIAVPTPFHSGYVPNIDYIVDATEKIAPLIKKNNIIILESTSPVGTTEKIHSILKSRGIDTSEVFISHCPERVLPGNIMKELVNNDRIVGGINNKSTDETVNFYSQFVKGDILTTDAKTAEMAKLTENSFRDVNIAFANELSILCDNLGMDVSKLIGLANKHPRVNILNPGPGVGGHCIAVDPWFIIHKDPENTKLIRAARELNNYKTDWVIKKIKKEAQKLKNFNTKIACLGLSFKPDIDDLRESPALHIVNELKKDGYIIMAVEPNIKNHPDLDIINLKDAIKSADLVIKLVDHKEFKSLNIKDMLSFS